MEALLFLLNSVAVLVVIAMEVRDDRRKPDTPPTSWFRSRGLDASRPEDLPASLRGHRTSRGRAR